MIQPNVCPWFEIPTTDLDRATRFYEAITNSSLRHEDMAGMQLRIFPKADTASDTGALVAMPGVQPSAQGTVVYLHLDDIRPALVKTPKAGGEVVLDRTALPNDIGYFAQILDSEGNRVGLFSKQ